MMLAGCTKRGARRHGDFGFLEQSVSELRGIPMIGDDSGKDVICPFRPNVLEHMRDAVEAFADQRAAAG